MHGSPAPTPRSGHFGLNANAPDGAFVFMDGEEYYRISAYHRMAPFLMSLTSDTDLWMFVTSRGGLTAGRMDPDNSLFPYLTVDQLHDSHQHTGPLTLIRLEGEGGKSTIWKPFSVRATNNLAIERNLYKNIVGNRLVFEEIHHTHHLAFRYSWSASDEFGWVRTCTLDNRGGVSLRASLLDGLRNVLPHGVTLALYRQASNLVDAYKKSEVDPETGIAIFSLTAGITDRAEALESLRANTVCCFGLDAMQIHLSHEVIRDFRSGRERSGEKILDGARGNYLVTTRLDLKPEESKQWHMIADVGRDHIQIAKRRRDLLAGRELSSRVQKSLLKNRDNLLRNVGSADGIQISGQLESSSQHFSNVLFNNMRGGVPVDNYNCPIADFSDFLRTRNIEVADRHRPLISELPETLTVMELLNLSRETDDPDFERLCHEYLPLYFGRRHGDPSRPWNRFSIRAHDDKGNRTLHYEGNWRDIFQNWEAMCTAFPAFLPSIVAKFVSASTIDGFNPYRISREGLDWETVHTDDPWGNIGYWGDHQIIYLQKLLEGMHKHYPDMISEMLGREIFSYAEVPYIIRPYADILKDAGATIDFDIARASRIDIRVSEHGMDGKLLTNSDGSVYRANLLEKLLVSTLAKLSNLIPDAGIWMNTQRPEWNDANNALGGGGVSAVTLYYLRRHLAYLADWLESLVKTSLPVSTEVAEWFGRIKTTFEDEKDTLCGNRLDPKDRKRLLDSLGEAFSDYRAAVYARGFAGKTELAVESVATFYRNALEYLEWGIRANRREDGLYHSYNLLEFSEDGSEVEVLHLEEMLEGQVAFLSSGLPDPEEALRILERLYESDLYRPSQRSFILYPERKLPGFMAKNMVPDEKAMAIPFLNDLLVMGDRSLLIRDEEGVLRFNGSFRNSRDLDATLKKFEASEEWSEGAARDHAKILELFEDVFRHKSYMGRSGVMYGYEGLGCIYWHMVAKLLLAVQEVYLGAEGESGQSNTRHALAEMFFKIRSGLGFEKTVAEYGAFPTDPYSHTSPSGSAKQPGMTGHVKEAILIRNGELGIHVEAGMTSFRPELLRSEEFLESPADFRYFDIDGHSRNIALPSGSLAFTFCQVPVIYERIQGDSSIRVTFADGSSTEFHGNQLDVRLSGEVFCRSGHVSRIRVRIPG